MTTPHRDELSALNERRETLSQELAKLKKEASELEELRQRAQVLATELAAVEARIGRGRRPLPMLNDVRVASPCDADWNEMLGDERVRHCLSCDKDVYNLSAMSRVEAEALLAARLDDETCIRLFRRADGTVMTQDCEVGVRRKRRRKLVAAAVGGGAMIAAGLSAFASPDAPCGVEDGRSAQPAFTTTATTTPVEIVPPEPMPREEMGADRAPEMPREVDEPKVTPPPPPSPPPTAHRTMGKLVRPR